MMNLAHLLIRSARSFSAQPAIFEGQRQVHDYGGLATRAAVLANHLADDCALLPGDRVALVMTNNPSYVEVLFGIWHAGLVAVPINAKLHSREVGYVLQHSGARICFVSGDLEGLATHLKTELPLERTVSVDSKEYQQMATVGRLAAIVPRAADDVAWLFYTSGTTGRPKGAMLTHRNLWAMTLAYFTDVDAVSPRDCIFHAAPMSHGSGLYAIPHVLQAAAHVIPESRKFDPAEIFDLLAVHRGVSFFAAPTMVKRLIDHPAGGAARLDNLKTIVYGGAPMYLNDIRHALDRFGQKFVQIYGQGESPMTITALSRARHAEVDHPRYLERLASVGTPHSVVEVRALDQQGKEQPVGEVGEVVVRGDSVMRGYWQDPQATASALKEGWLYTGDVGAFDADGFLTLKDRSKDLIISGGSNIYPREIEEVLLKHAGVREVSVVGRPHPDWGEEVVAFVVASAPGSVDAAALDALCRENIARFKRPKAYRFVDSLPKNNYGKVLKTELRRRLAEEREADES